MTFISKVRNTSHISPIMPSSADSALYDLFALGLSMFSTLKGIFPLWRTKLADKLDEESKLSIMHDLDLHQNISDFDNKVHKNEVEALKYYFETGLKPKIISSITKIPVTKIYKMIRQTKNNLVKADDVDQNLSKRKEKERKRVDKAIDKFLSNNESRYFTLNHIKAH
jgi:hypothetical protein